MANQELIKQLDTATIIKIKNLQYKVVDSYDACGYQHYTLEGKRGAIKTLSIKPDRADQIFTYNPRTLSANKYHNPSDIQILETKPVEVVQEEVETQPVQAEVESTQEKIVPVVPVEISVSKTNVDPDEVLSAVTAFSVRLSNYIADKNIDVTKSSMPAIVARMLIQDYNHNPIGRSGPL